MFVRALLITSFAFIAAGVSVPDAIAQDDTVKGAAKAEKKATPTERPTAMEAIKQTVKDLSDEQKEKLDALQKKAGAQQKAFFEAAGITWKVSKQRSEFVKELKAKGVKGKEIASQANKEVGYTEEQAAAQVKVGKVWADFRFAIVKVLTDDQRKQLPKWLTDSHAARLKAEKEKAAAEKK